MELYCKFLMISYYPTIFSKYFNTLDKYKRFKQKDFYYIYVNSIKEPEKVLLAITQDVVIEKDLDGALEFLNKLIEQHNKQIQFLRTQLQNVEMTLQQISQNVQRGYT